MTPITHQIPETGYELLIIGFKEPVKSIELSMSSKMLFYSRFGLPSKAVELPHVYDSLGLLSELTEEKLEGVMPKDGLGMYKDFMADKGCYWAFAFATFSFASLMQSLQVYTKNPYGDLYKAIRSGTARSKDGAEKDRGHIVHLVGSNDYPSWQTALCGVDPKGNGWHYYTDGMDITCERCNNKSKQWQQAQQRVIKDAAVLFRKIG